MLAATEARVDAKIAQLKSLQSQITALLAQRDAAQEKQVASLVKTYSAMKPKDAARIFDSLPDDVLVPVAAGDEVGRAGARAGGDEPGRGPETDRQAGQQADPAGYQCRHGSRRRRRLRAAWRQPACRRRPKQRRHRLRRPRRRVTHGASS